MLLSRSPYLDFHFAALAAVSVMTPASLEYCAFCSAGAIWFSLRPPRPQSAQPSFFGHRVQESAAAIAGMSGASGASAAAAAIALD